MQSTGLTVTQFEDSFSEEVWKSTYKDHKDETVDDTFRRIARYVAGAEPTKELKSEWENKFFDMLSEFKCTAGGRIYSNAGTEWAGTTLMNCFSPEVQVLTLMGLKNICDVEIGDYVLTHKGRFREVVNTMSRFYEGTVQRFSSTYFTADIISTPEHPYYQGNEKWVKSGEVEHVALLYKGQVADSNAILDLAELLHDKVQQGLVVVEDSLLRTKREYVGHNGSHMTKRGGHSVQRFIRIGTEFAYLLGRFVGDGCTFKNNQHSLFETDAFTIAYNTTTEQQHAQKMVELFERVFGITPNIITSQNNTTYVRKASLIVAETLRRLVGNGFATKFIPNIIWNGNIELQESFLLGLFDSDGFVNEKGQLMLELTNEPLLLEVQTMLTSLGIPTSRSGKRLFAGTTFSQRFRASMQKIYEDDRLTTSSSKPPTTGPIPIPSGTFFPFNEGFSVVPERQDEHYSGYVYNISVDEDNSYVVNNVVVHNCYVSPRDNYDIDSLDGILRDIRNQCQTLKSEGGWGQNFSWIRPRGSFIHGIGVESPGAVKYMEIYDKTSDVITSGSGKKALNKKAKGKIRKGAMMGVLDCWHPDIVEFITAKQQPGRLTKFNVSVNCTDEFMDKVVRVIEGQNNNEDIAELDKWDLRFPDTTYDAYKEEWDGNLAKWESKGYPVIKHRTISVLKLWNLIMESTYNRAEPGVLFLDRANHFLPLSYKETVFATNPCGEQTLAPGGVCNLGSINLTQFIDEESNGFDLDAIKKYTRYLCRFLDNINSLSYAPLPEYIESMRKKRRIGIGILGWGSALFMLKTRFASERANILREQVMKTIAREAYMASIDLAEEKGMFEYCTPELHANGAFIRSLHLPEEYIEKLRTVGIRNSSLLSIQPTGNTSIFANVVSGGLEPVFLPEYIRTVIVNTMPDEIADVCPKWYEGEWKETSVFKFDREGDEEILKGVGPSGTVYKIDKNRGLTKEVLCQDYGVRWLANRGQWDSSADWASTTLNLDVNDHLEDLKGFARWIDSAISKTINVPNDYPFDLFKNIYLESYKSGYIKGVTTYRSGTMTAVLSAKEEQNNGDVEEEIIFDDAKLPTQSPATMSVIRAEGKKWYLTTVMDEELRRPVAFFVHTNHHEKTGVAGDAADKLIALAKEKNIPEKWINSTLEKIEKDNNVTKVARCISLNLRHGVLIKSIVSVLDRVDDAYVGTFVFQIKKFLSQYIKDGEKVENEKCLDCGSDKVVYREGCKVCLSCGSSKCG